MKESGAATALTLFTLPPSHYCERARWALDHMKTPYTERRLAVGMHGPIIRRIASRTMLPVLRAGSRIIQGSGDILDWTGVPGADPEIERQLDERLGSLVRLYAYSATLGGLHHGVVRDMLLDGTPAWQAWPTFIGWPLLRRAMIAGLDAREERLPDLSERIDAEFDWFETRLGGRAYLGGSRFGRANITAASLLSPLARPAVVPLYRSIRFSKTVEATVAGWNERPVLRWVTRIYAEHRQAPPAQTLA